MLTQHKNNRKQAFTLIELLVVVSIIALLVSILLPALGRAREQARRVVCAAGQRGIVLAASLYAEDYENRVSAGHNGFGGGTDWIQVRSPVVRQGFAPYIYAGYIEAADIEIFHCPSDKGKDIETGEDYGGKNVDDWERRWNNYNFNPTQGYNGQGDGDGSAEDTNICSSYYIYAEGWEAGQVNNTGSSGSPKAFQYFPQEYFGVFSVEGPWMGHRNGPVPMASWHGGTNANRGWNAAGLNGVVTFVEANKISGSWLNGCVWSNLWADNADYTMDWIWVAFSDACGFVNAYPRRLEGISGY